MPSASPKAQRRQRSQYSFRSFYITVLVISALAILSLAAHQAALLRQGVRFGVAEREFISRLNRNKVGKRDDAECRFIHQVQDQCAFIGTNCQDEDSGLFSYLSLYYCGLTNAKPVAFAILTLWLALLFTTIGIAASDFFCINLSTISRILGLTDTMAGVTFLAFGNGSPDVFSTFAAMSTHSGSLAIGELIGAAGFITAVVAGSMAISKEFQVAKKTFIRDVGFFIVATSFTMVFLADGKLLLWECVTMVTFYIFYVVVVVIWHWYFKRQAAKKKREAAARGHYHAPGNEDIEAIEETQNEEDGVAQSMNSQAITPSDAIEALERGQSWRQEDGNDSDENDEQRRLVAAEMASEMRVTRPRYRRKNTVSAIRPSLLGALEFRSVLSSLQRSRSAHSANIHLRRYSDEAVPMMDPHSVSDMMPGLVTGQIDSSRPLEQNPSARLRAGTMNDIHNIKALNPAAFNVASIPEIGVVGATPSVSTNDTTPFGPAAFHAVNMPEIGAVSAIPSFSTNEATLLEPARSNDSAPLSPTFSLSPPASNRGSTSSSPAPSPSRPRFSNSLAPPEPEIRIPNSRQFYRDNPSADSSSRSQQEQPPRPLRLLIPDSRNNSREQSPASITRFPLYTDSPMPMSAQGTEPPSISVIPADDTTTSSLQAEEVLIRWWPYGLLPSPEVLLSTLFPTLYAWKSKTLGEKLIGLVSAPSVFMLAITLPIVEPPEKKMDEEDDYEVQDRSRSRSRSHISLMPGSPSLGPTPSEEWLEYRRNSRSRERRSRATSPVVGSLSGTAATAINAENAHAHSHPTPAAKLSITAEEILSPSVDPDGLRDWNRWLLSIQIFTAPLFLIFVVWATSGASFHSHKLVKSILYALLASLVTYGILVVTTTSERPPKYRFLFCFVGFIVSIAWISTIANEVVAVLKAFGIIFGISDAILGLTIFAVGNSLGDLVADITVANLGNPVMALSACFGGPMLNILLGIGLGGFYMTVTDATEKQHKHPKRPVTYKPYEIQVSGTLMISAITLLVTLVGLLIAVPMNDYWMNRKIGWSLITLWSVSTVLNLVVEMTGVLGDVASIQT